MWNFKERFSLSKDVILFHCINRSDQVIISHRDFPEVTVTVPIGYNMGTLNSITNIANELRRVTSILSCGDLLRRHKNKELLIYHNTLIAPIVETLFNHNSYSKYHLFCSSPDCYSLSYILLHNRYNTEVLRINDSESNMSSMLRILRNDYDEYYDEEYGPKHDNLIVLSNCNTLEELTCALQWKKDCYISMPYNPIIIMIIRYLFRYYCKIDLLVEVNGFCVVKCSRDKHRYMSTSMMVEKIKNLYDKMYKKLRPMTIVHNSSKK